MAWLKAGEKKKGAKYIARVELKGKKNKYRYFYDQDEYDAYLKEQEEDDDDRGSIFDKIKNTVKSAASSVKDAVDKGEETIKKTASDVVDKASDTATSIKSSLKKTTEELKDTVDDGKNIVENTMKKAAEKVSSAKTSVEDAVEETTKDIKKTLKSTTKEIQDTVDKGSETVKKIASDTTKDIQNTISKGASFVADVIDSSKDVALGGKKKSTFENIVKKAKDFINDCESEVESFTDVLTVNNKIFDGFTKAVFDNVIDAVSDIFDGNNDGSSSNDDTNTDVTDTNTDVTDTDNNGWPDWFYDNFADVLNVQDYVTEGGSALDNLTDQDYINPFFWYGEYEYKNNCAYCTAAYELRRRGYDVEAAPIDRSTINTLDVVASWYVDPDISNVVYNSDNDTELDKAVSDVTASLLSEGEGARGQFCVYWDDGGGHSVVWEVYEGEAILRDCQTNQVVSLYDYMSISYEVNYWRTDNLELNDSILDAVRNEF